MEPIGITLYAPLIASARRQLLADWQFGVREVAVEATTAIDAGFDSATIRAPAHFRGMPLYSLLQGRADVVPFAHIEIRLGGSLIWQGMVTRYLMDGLDLVGLGCVGYGRGLHHRPWSGAAGTALTVLQQMVRDTAPFISLGPPSLMADPGFALTADQTARLYFNDLIQMVNLSGSVQGRPVACQVWDGPLGPQLVIVPQVVPDQPDIAIPPLDPELEIDDIDLEQLVNVVSVTSGETTIQRPASIGDVDMSALAIVREEAIDIGEGASATQMEAFARARLAAYGAIRVSGRWTTREWIPTPSGAEIPPASVRAGAWALVPSVGVLQITGTTYRYPAGAWSCTFGALSPEAHWFAQLRGVMVGSYRRLNPLNWLRS